MKIGNGAFFILFYFSLISKDDRPDFGLFKKIENEILNQLEHLRQFG